MGLALRTVHLLAAATWLGGMLFIALVLVPVLRRLDDPALRTRLVHDTGMRFRPIGWMALGLLVATGLVQLALRPWLLSLPLVQLKLALVALALGLAALHDFALGPRAGAPGADPRLRARASWAARLNVLVVLAIVVLGLSLRG